MCNERPDILFLATGSEVAIALGARALLAEGGVRAAVVSMPCWELFEAQDESYRAQTLGRAPRVSVEAGVTFGWSTWADASVGLDGFGVSAPYQDAYAHFGITAEAVSERAREAIGSRAG